MNIKRKMVVGLLVVSTGLVTLTGCTGNAYRDRQIVGTGGGAVLGGLVGHAIGGNTAGTVIGGALGAGVGSAVSSDPSW